MTTAAKDDCYLISNAEAARRIGISPKTLERWRYEGKGPDFVRLGGSTGRVRYRPADLERWAAGLSRGC